MKINWNSIIDVKAMFKFQSVGKDLIFSMLVVIFYYVIYPKVGNVLN